jgi:hypothetical protein
LLLFFAIAIDNFILNLFVFTLRKVKDLTQDNQMLVSKILELKDEQAKAFNEANKIYMDAQRMKNVRFAA